MRSSRFNIVVEDYPVKGQNILYNARTQALIRIDHAFRDALLRLDESVDIVRAQDPRLKDSVVRLRENGIIVESQQEETRKLDDFFRQLKAGSDRLAFEVTVLTTYACNFRCVYCFEESVKRNVMMDEPTAQAVVEWLIRRVRERGIREVVCVFYGGEPLLNVPAIRFVSERFGRWARGHGVGFRFSIITNGSLVTRSLVDELLPLGLKLLRISLDGDRDCHDAKRPFCDGSPTFDRIVGNIRDVIDQVPVAIAGNFDRDNFGGISRLLDYLEAEGLLRKLSSVDFLPIAPRLGPRNNPGAIELGECVSFFGKDGMFREILEVKKLLASRGIDTPTGLAVNACSLIMRDSAAAIDPCGDIYLCNALIGYPEFSVGRITDEGFNGREAVLSGADAWNQCAPDCPYVPLCQGGCRFFSFLEHQDFTSLVCKRDYFDRIVPELIKLEYRKLMKDTCEGLNNSIG